ncbi:MAG: CCA tRNA nucleotidyltransferase, partial [Pseudomonadota bacterium]
LEDLHARRVRFIEDAAIRICEDYLRILRFFRFHAWFGDPVADLDADGLAACAELADGMSRLSKERIGAETTKLLAATDPAPSVAAMRTAGVLARVLPGADDRLLAPLVHFEAQSEGDLPPAYLRRLAVLGGEDVADNLRLSKTDARRLDLLREEMGKMTSAKELGYRHGAALGLDVFLLRATMSNMPPSDKDLQDLAAGAKAVFPVKAADLMPDYEGPALGQKLTDLETTWIASGFALTARELLG